MNLSLRALRRPALAVVALAIAATSFLPALAGRAFAFGQVTSRSIQMSTASAGATNVNYLVTFTPASGSVIKAIAVDFCSNDPLIGDACTQPTGFSVGTPTVTGASVYGETGGSWTAASINSGRTLTLSNGSAVGPVSGTVSFTLTTASNPSAPAATFYARIFTFAATADLTTWSGTADGSYAGTAVLDAGGIALSTVTDITITARVMERLTFCTSNATLSASDCSAASATVALTIGHVTGTGTTKAIDDSVVDAASAYTQLSTNATNGAIVRMKNMTSTACGGLSRDNGTTCEIAAIGGSAALFPTPPATSAKFGMCVIPDSGLAAYAPYDGSSPGTTACTDTLTPASTASYGMGDTTATTTYGDQIFHTSPSGPVSKKNAILNFAAIAATTTPSGIYKATESLVATGTF